MSAPDEKVLECLLCRERSSHADVVAGAYRVETLVCSACYRRMQAKPHRASCFGKPTFVADDGRESHGYDEAAEECGELCPDAAVCRLVVCGANGIVRSE